MRIDELWAYISTALNQPAVAYWPVYLGFMVVVALLVVLVVGLLSRRRGDDLERALADISLDRLRNVVLPKADDGEIHIDHILLTGRGVLIVDAKEIRGIVFGGDRMHDWTVMDNGRRYTIANPQASLFDRIAAVKLIVTNVPVEGRIVFGSEADFSKGIPSLVCTEQSLRKEWAAGTQAARSAFDAEWQQLRDATFR